MPGDVDIVNLALTQLGQARLTTLQDATKAARSATAIYDLERKRELRAHRWRFATARILLPALTGTPPFGFQFQYQLPSDYLQAIAVGWFAPGADLAIYRGGQDEVDYRIEGQTILWGKTFNFAPTPPATAVPSALPLRYIRDVTDTNQFDACFVNAFACRLAMNLSEDITQQASKRQLAQQEYKVAIMEALQTNAIEQPPEQLNDGTWLRSRLPG